MTVLKTNQPDIETGIARQALSVYVAASKGLTSPVKLATFEQSDASYLDGDIEVQACRSRFVFTDGVVLEHYCEAEAELSTNECACAECWIDYRIVATPPALMVSPPKKHFTSHCQEAFWLRIQQHQCHA